MFKARVLLVIVVISLFFATATPAKAAPTQVQSMLCREQIQKVAEILTGANYERLWPGDIKAIWAVNETRQYIGFIVPAAGPGTINMIVSAIETASGISLPANISVTILNALLQSWSRSYTGEVHLILWEDFSPCDDDDMPKPPPVIPIGMDDSLLKPVPAYKDLPWAAFELSGVLVADITQTVVPRVWSPIDLGVSLVGALIVGIFILLLVRRPRQMRPA